MCNNNEDLTFNIRRNGGTVTDQQFWIATASASTTGRELGSNYVSATTDGTMSLPVYRVSLSGSATYYLNGVVTYSVVPAYDYRFSARRVR